MENTLNNCFFFFFAGVDIMVYMVGYNCLKLFLDHRYMVCNFIIALYSY